jgi:hypothetical protein
MPNEQESLAGYLWRLSEVNGYTGVDHLRRVYSKPLTLWKSMHRPYRGDDAEDKLIPHLIAITGLKAEVFRESLFKDLPGKNERDNRVDVSLFDWRIGVPRICPDCLLQAAMMPKEWELLPFSVCPVHKKSLIHECPACGESLDLHADLATHCHACEVKWADSCIENREVPEYQAEWLAAKNGSEWLHEFGWMLLKAVRPMDFQHNGIKFYDAPVSRLPTLLDAAWNLMKSGRARDDWEAIRAFRFGSLSGLMLNRFHVKAGLPHTSGVPENLVQDHEMKPRWARLNYSSEVIGWTLDTGNLISAMGLEKMLSPYDIDDNASFQSVLRDEARSIIDRFGFTPVKKERDPKRKRYDIRIVNEWIERIPLYESSENTAELYWAKVNDPLLRLFNSSIISLAEAIHAGRVCGYRRLHSGISCLGVEYATLRDWLTLRLDITCSEPIEIYTLRAITYLSRNTLIELAAAKILVPTRGEFQGRYYTGDSVKRFILANEDRLLRITGSDSDIDPSLFV